MDRNNKKMYALCGLLLVAMFALTNIAIGNKHAAPVEKAIVAPPTTANVRGAVTTVVESESENVVTVEQNVVQSVEVPAEESKVRSLVEVTADSTANAQSAAEENNVGAHVEPDVQNAVVTPENSVQSVVAPAEESDAQNSQVSTKDSEVRTLVETVEDVHVQSVVAPVEESAGPSVEVSTEDASVRTLVGAEEPSNVQSVQEQVEVNNNDQSNQEPVAENTDVRALVETEQAAQVQSIAAPIEDRSRVESHEEPQALNTVTAVEESSAQNIAVTVEDSNNDRTLVQTVDAVAPVEQNAAAPVEDTSDRNLVEKSEATNIEASVDQSAAPPVEENNVRTLVETAEEPTQSAGTTVDEINTRNDAAPVETNVDQSAAAPVEDNNIRATAEEQSAQTVEAAARETNMQNDAAPVDESATQNTAALVEDNSVRTLVNSAVDVNVEQNAPPVEDVRTHVETAEEPSAQSANAVVEESNSRNDATPVTTGVDQGAPAPPVDDVRTLVETSKEQSAQTVEAAAAGETNNNAARVEESAMQSAATPVEDNNVRTLVESAGESSDQNAGAAASEVSVVIDTSAPPVEDSNARTLVETAEESSAQSAGSTVEEVNMAEDKGQNIEVTDTANVRTLVETPPVEDNSATAAADDINLRSLVDIGEASARAQSEVAQVETTQNIENVVTTAAEQVTVQNVETPDNDRSLVQTDSEAKLESHETPVENIQVQSEAVNGKESSGDHVSPAVEDTKKSTGLWRLLRIPKLKALWNLSVFKTSWHLSKSSSSKSLRQNGGSTGANNDQTAADSNARRSLINGYDDTVSALPSFANSLAYVWNPIQPSDQPIFWYIGLAGGATFADIAAKCLGLVQCSPKGPGNGTETPIAPPVQVTYHSDDGAPYLNLNPGTTSGLDQIAALKIVQSRQADLMVTPLITYASASLFDSSHQGRVFAMLRHPVKRIVDQFYYRQAATWDPSFDPALAIMSIDDFAASDHVYDNVMVRMLANVASSQDVTPDELQVAKDILRQKVVVGIQEWFEASIVRFEQYFGWWEKYNVTGDATVNQCHSDQVAAMPTYPSIISGGEAWQTLAVRNWADLELYSYAKRLFAQQNSLITA